MWSELTDDQKKFINDLVRASVLDNIREDEVEELIESGAFKSMEDYMEMIKDAEKVSPHKCNSRCVACVAP
eukprot:11389592-Ditylum_brightwellii.AAC.1